MSLTTTLNLVTNQTIPWPESVNDAPAGWRWGARVELGARGYGYYMIREEDDATLIAIQRQDLTEEDVPDEHELEYALEKDNGEKSSDGSDRADYDV